MTVLLNFRTQCARAHVSPYFFPHIVCLRIYCLFFFFFGFYLLFHENHSHCQAVTVCARAQAAVLPSSGHSVSEIAKLFKKAEQWVRNKWSLRKSFKDKPRSRRPSIFTNYARNRITRAKYERNNSTRKIATKLQHHDINVSCTTVWRLTNKE